MRRCQVYRLRRSNLPKGYQRAASAAVFCLLAAAAVRAADVCPAPPKHKRSAPAAIIPNDDHRIRIESDGHTHQYGPGEAWFESGAAPVLAPTSQEAETSFVRCFILPRQCKGKSSIRYVKPEDASRPKPQRYKVLGERFIALSRG